MADDASMDGRRMEALNGWKAIAACLRRDERTAMRWATERGMPVHRMPGPRRGSVYAVAKEIKTWLEVDRERAAEAGRLVPTLIDSAAVARMMLGLSSASIVGVRVAAWVGRSRGGARLSSEEIGFGRS